MEPGYHMLFWGGGNGEHGVGGQRSNEGPTPWGQWQLEVCWPLVAALPLPTLHACARARTHARKLAAVSRADEAPDVYLPEQF